MDTKRVSGSQPDMLSSLPDVLLILIISLLPFNEGIRTSVLSKRWKNLCYEIKNIAFKEPNYINNVGRILFVRSMRLWVARFQGIIESFEISLSNPVGFVADIEYLIDFAVSRQVKKLILDFSNPSLRTTLDASLLQVVFELPASVYRLRTLESLCISACGFDPSRFTNPELLRSLSISWISLKQVESLLPKCPLLESLSIKHCWDLDIMMIAGQIRELVFVNCDFPLMSCSFDLPNIEIFKYTGYMICLHFRSVNTMMKEVYLNFDEEKELDTDPFAIFLHKAGGKFVSRLLNACRFAKTLTVCPYLLQVIQECDIPAFLLRDVDVRYLVLRTKMQPKEFMGIRLLLDNCPDLETLTIDHVHPKPSASPRTSLSHGIDPQTHWLQNISYKCLRRTLRVVVFKNFIGSFDQLQLLQHFIRTGDLLERVDVHVRDKVMKLGEWWVRDQVMMLQKTTNRAKIILHSV
ncbi:hypothetical protein EUTSA_v10015307mg [Eutrema salsugineum]|uniref:F-box domain-containing protein n=1 Tax=Eutrema salsugineum TaxID=72664 RepID=V4KYG4_EUTSA|nr:putative F-box/LRR-repeat protein At5g54820 [Eutrema salsugineum]ESQ42985.1 hypothetical protein EUTSA_v10015307mg [Eutrema salsugineum]